MLPSRVGEREQGLLGADSLLMAQLLWNRGVRTDGEARAFLDPVEHGQLADPSTMLGVPLATARLIRAIGQGEPVAVYADYDVDGIAGAALLSETLRDLGGHVIVHVPHRSRDGYGVNADAVESLASAGARVIVTVDCGISAHHEVGRAIDLGVDAIVTDHHSVPSELPAALAVVNPHQPGCAYPFKDLAGGAVAFQLARSLLLAALRPEDAVRRWQRLAAFAALSTVADMVPLVGENRTIVAQGLEAARGGTLWGIRAICEIAGRDLDRLSAHDLAFQVIPRLNAAGRMGDPHDALDVLLAPDGVAAQAIAQRLDGVNNARRTLMSTILSSIDGQLVDPAEGSVVLAGNYPIGLAGLIAGRLVERHAVPCVVIERGDEISRGSARGIEGVHLIRVLEACSETLIQFGGHERAAGFSLYTGQIERFARQFVSAVRLDRGELAPARELWADGVIQLASVGDRLVDLVERFEPVGMGNARPAFVSRSVLIRHARRIGGGHIRMTVVQGGVERAAVAFRPTFPLPQPGARLDILYGVERSWWQGESRVDIIVRDARPARPGPDGR